MGFDSSRAWNQAIDWVRTHMNMVVPLAGVFVLIPSLALFWFTGDLQAEIQAKTQAPNPEKVMFDVLGLMGQFFGLIMLMSIVQSIGTMAMTAVFADRARPTVGEAINLALRCLPTVIGTVILTILVFLGAAIVWAIVLGLLAGLIAAVAGAGAATAVGLMAGFALVGAILLLSVRFIMVSPVIVLERVTNPVEALRRSWRMTSGHIWGLLLFFVLLWICYFVISSLIGAIVGLVTGGGMFASPAQLSTGALVANGLVSGIMGTAATAVFTAVITACYQQLGNSGGTTVSETFD